MGTWVLMWLEFWAKVWGWSCSSFLVRLNSSGASGYAIQGCRFLVFSTIRLIGVLRVSSFGVAHVGDSLECKAPIIDGIPLKIWCGRLVGGSSRSCIYGSLSWGPVEVLCGFFSYGVVDG